MGRPSSAATGPRSWRSEASRPAARALDSTAGSSEAVHRARELAGRTGAVVAVSGEVDYVTDGDEVVGVPGGRVLLTKVTGTGCALGAVIAAFLAASETPLQAAVLPPRCSPPLGSGQRRSLAVPAASPRRCSKTSYLVGGPE